MKEPLRFAITTLWHATGPIGLTSLTYFVLQIACHASYHPVRPLGIDHFATGAGGADCLTTSLILVNFTDFAIMSP